MDFVGKPASNAGVKIAGAVAVGVTAATAFLVLSARRSGRSLQAELLTQVAAPLINRAGATSTPTGQAAAIAKNRRAGAARPPASLRARYAIEGRTVDGARVLVLHQKGSGIRQHVLYLHGGAFELDLLPQHWTIIGGLADRLDADLTIPLYPLAPENDYRGTDALLDRVYGELVERAGSDCVAIAGDSAGGALALSLCQRLRDHKAKMPAALALFSPWADLTVSDPAQTELAKKDKLLSISRLRAAGKAWSGPLAPNDARVNPLFASMAGLPPTLILTGTDDVLNSDAHRLMTSARAVQANFTLSEYPRMFHVWPAVNIPEGVKALDEAAAFIGKHVTGW